MKKFITLILSLFLVGLVAMPVIAGDYSRFNATEIKRTRGDKQEGRDTFRAKDDAGVVRFKVQPDGSIILLNSSGVTTTNFPSTPVILIDSVDDLSTWPGAAAGSSYFQTEAGRTYIVDPIAIVSTGTAPGSGVSTVAFSGVSAILPLVTTGNDHGTVTIVYGRASSGTSTSPIPFEVQVWPAPLAGATRWGYQTIGNQNIAGQTTSGTSTVAISATTGSRNINEIGKKATFMLFYNSAVSAQLLNNVLTGD